MSSLEHKSVVIQYWGQSMGGLWPPAAQASRLSEWIVQTITMKLETWSLSQRSKENSHLSIDQEGIITAEPAFVKVHDEAKHRSDFHIQISISLQHNPGLASLPFSR